MNNMIKTNLMQAKRFSNTMRYIDDLLTLNNTSFDSAIDDEELKLKKTSESPTILSYLDIHITITNGKYSTAVYDKRDDFNFKIGNFPYLSSNIPSRPAYGVCISELVRIGIICSDYLDFTLRHFKLTERLVHQGYRYSDLYRSFYKFAAQIMNKYSCSIRKHVEDVYQQWIGSSVAMSRIDRMYIFSDIYLFWKNISIFLLFIFFFHVYMLCVI